MTFNEANSVRDLVRDRAVARGWAFVPGNETRADNADYIVAAKVREALARLNPEIAEKPALADEVLQKLQAVAISARQGGNLVTANEEYRAWLASDRSMPFGPGGEHVPIRLIDFDDPCANDLVVSTEVTFSQGAVARRFDLVFWVNGLPLVVGEAKTPTRPAYSWVDAAAQVHDDYEKNMPMFFVPNVLSFGTDGKDYRYGSVGMPIDLWGPWREANSNPTPSLEAVGATVDAMLRPEVILDFLRFFAVFATDKKHRKIKVIARYQQFQATNQIVDRVVAGRVKKGLIWHFQGSGKSLLMVFAASKLRAHPVLKSPTVIIVVDRIDLDTQITATFNATDVPNMVSTDSREELHTLLRQGTRKVIITTIHKFGEANGVLDDRSNIIVMVDEAHRTQEGDLGHQMRSALPNAFLFGLTGTPINRADRNTFWAFGAEEDAGGYMSKYSFSDSIRDGATLPLHFEPRLVELRVDREALDAGFEALAEGLSETERAVLAKKTGDASRLIKARERVAAVAADIAAHYKANVEPNGFKAQVVVIDKQACVLYKKALDEILLPDESAIVMSMDARDPQEWRDDYGLDKDAEARLLDRYRDPKDPLKVLIVTAKLLTGFDAPILQAQYLDRPLRDHNLLQAICRTNRPAPGKPYGLIVDYLGIFDDVAQALEFDDESVKRVITNLNEVKAQLPAAMKGALSFFPGVDRTVEGHEGLMAAQQCLPGVEARDKFAAAYAFLSRLWEALSPDPVLNEYRDDYRWLSDVYESVKPFDPAGRLVWHRLGPKTLELVNAHVHVDVVREDLDTIELEAELLESLGDRIDEAEAKKKAKHLDILLAARLGGHRHDPRFVAIGERLEALRDKFSAGLMNSVEFLKSLLELAQQTAVIEKTVEAISKEEQGKAALTALFESIQAEETPVMVARVVEDIDAIVREVRFPDWQATSAGEREVKKALRQALLHYKLHREQELFDKAYGYIREYY